MCPYFDTKSEFTESVNSSFSVVNNYEIDPFDEIVICFNRAVSGGLQVQTRGFSLKCE